MSVIRRLTQQIYHFIDFDHHESYTWKLLFYVLILRHTNLVVNIRKTDNLEKPPFSPSRFHG
jgi:hypothetical protein